MASYLLDADAVIDYIKRYPPTIELIRRLIANEDRLCTCDIVLAEVYSGLMPQDEPAGVAFLSAMEFLPASAAAAEQAGRWRYQFARQGRMLPTTDALVAATALEYGATVVTANARDYPMPEVSVLSLTR